MKIIEKEQDISFETAKLLKEKGVEPTSKCYDANGKEVTISLTARKILGWDKEYYPRVTQTQLKSFLTKHDILIEIMIDKTTYPKYCFKINNYESFGNYRPLIADEFFLYRKYEEALEDAFIVALKHF